MYRGEILIVYFFFEWYPQIIFFDLNKLNKDYFEYIYQLDVFKCQKNNICTFMENTLNHTKTLIN